MWHIVIINLYFSIYLSLVKSAWVEIPQLPNDKPPERIQQKPAQFVLGTPKVSFVEQKATPPSNHRISTTPSTNPKPTPYSSRVSTNLKPTPYNHRVLTTPRIPTTTLQNYRDVMTTVIQPLTTRPRKTHPQARITQNEKPTINKTEDSYSGFLPFLKSIQETLTANARKSLKSKISLLTNLKDNLLTNIDEKITNLWEKSDDLEARGHDDHEMDFPSNEGALMTIGFLTFAVFLIKLVLKLIHALKYKQATPVVVTTVAPATALIGRKKRDLDESLKILQLIDEYRFT